MKALIRGPFSLFGSTPLITDLPPPHCNQLGLTAIGRYLINAMIRRHLVIELDHMDVKTADAALSLIEQHHYAGVVSAHSWDTPDESARIYLAGGFVAPSKRGTPDGFIRQWLVDRTDRPGGFLLVSAMDLT
jgi:hypothetical protein